MMTEEEIFEKYKYGFNKTKEAELVANAISGYIPMNMQLEMYNDTLQKAIHEALEEMYNDTLQKAIHQAFEAGADYERVSDEYFKKFEQKITLAERERIKQIINKKFEGDYWDNQSLRRDLIKLIDFEGKP